MALTDYRVSVFSHDYASCKVLDCVQSDFGGGLIRIEDLQSGCGSATLALGLRLEELIARGYWTARNIVEVSSGDDALAAPVAAGATSLPTLNPQLYDTALGEDTPQVYLYDGSTLAMRIPVTGVTASSITIGQPKDVNGNPYALPAFAQGTVLGRRRYAGYVMRRETANEKDPKASVTLAGIGRRLSEAIGTFTYNAQDVGVAVGLAINGFSSRYPELVAGTYPTVGSTYTGSKERVSVLKMVGEALSAVTNGDLWVLRVGHDRTPRLLKLYTSASNSYNYTQTFLQGVTYFEPVGFKQSGEDASRLFNSVEVIGDTDPATKQPARAIVQDTTSIALYGQIDSAPVTNTACKTTATCAVYAKAILLQQSLALSDNTFRVYTHNDNPSTNGLPSNATQQSGDVVRAISNIVVKRFDGGRSVANFAPDSEIRYGSGTNTLWSGGGGMTASVGGGPSGSNAFTANTGTAYIYSPAIDVNPGQVWSWDGYLDATAITAGTIQWQAYNVQGATVIAAIGIGATSGGQRPSGSFTIPSGCYSLKLVASMNGATGTGKFAQPNLNLGSILKSYTQNYAIPDVYGIATSVISTYDSHGDSYQDVRFAAIQPDANAAISERANAVATALQANTAPRIGIDSYIVSAEAFGYSYNGLVVSAPSFLATFARGTTVVSAGGNTFTLQSSATNWVSLNPDASWTVKQDPSPVTGAILYAIFQTNATTVVGSINKAPIGVFKVGVGNVNVAANLPAPALGATTVVNGQSANGTASDIDVTVPLTNVPGEAKALQFYHRLYNASAVRSWIPDDAVQLAGVPSPPVSQTVGFSFALMEHGTSYDFACGYESLGGYGPLTILAANFAARAFSVPPQYLVSGKPTQPTVTGAGATSTTSADGLSATVSLPFTITNQPTDGSLARVQLWRRPTATYNAVLDIGAASFNFTPVGGQNAVGAGSGTYPASGAYTFTDDTTGGIPYDYAVSEVSQSGAESRLLILVTNFIPRVIALTAQQLAAASSIPTPVLNVPATSVANQRSVNGLAADILATVALTNVPTDGSVTEVEFYFRVAGTPTWVPYEAVNLAGLPTPAAVQTVSFLYGAVTNSTSYDFGVAFVGVSGAYGPIAAFASNFVATVVSIPTTYLTNNGAALALTLTGTSAANVASANGISAAVQLQATITNQPTDGSTSRYNLWRRPTSIANDGVAGARQPGNAACLFQPIGGGPAVGADSFPGPASGTYNDYDGDVAAGSNFDYGISLENTAGGESLIATITLNFATSLVIISPGQTSFSNILNSNFNGLQVDASGNLAMTAIREIYPAQTTEVLDNGITNFNYWADFRPSKVISFEMRFQLSNVGTHAGLVVLSDATAAGTDYQNGYMLQWTSGALNLYKRVAGTFNTLLSVATVQGIGAANTVPAEDTNWHTLRLSVDHYSPLSAVGIDGVILSIYLDGIGFGSVTEYARAGTATTGNFGNQILYQVGGVNPFTSGRCGPANRDLSSTTLIDPKTFSVKNGSSEFAENNPQAVAALIAPQSNLPADGNPLQSQSLVRRNDAGVAGAAGNLIYNPSFGRGTTGWSVYNIVGAGGTSTTDPSYVGGRLYLAIAAGTNSGADLLYQQTVINPVASYTYTVSGYVESGTITNAGAYANVDVINCGTGGSADGIGSKYITISNSGAVYFSFSYTTGTANVAPVVRCRVYAGGNAPTALTSAYFYRLKVEVGTLATAFTDDQMSAISPQAYTTGGRPIYSDGTTVDGLRPASAGADVTANDPAVSGALLRSPDAFGSYVKPGRINRLHSETSGNPGATNLIFNPTFGNGASGWNRTGNAQTSTVLFDGYGGGRLYLNNSALPAGSFDGYIQAISVFQNQSVVLSAIIESTAGPAGVVYYAEVLNAAQTAVIAGGSLAVNGAQAANRYPLAAAFNTGGNSTVYVRVYMYNTTGAASAAVGGFYKLQLEYGTQPSAWSDHRSGVLTTQTHDTGASLVGVGASRFVTGNTVTSPAQSDSTYSFPISIDLRGLPGTWFLDVSWFVSGGTGVSNSLETAIANTGGAISGFTNNIMNVGTTGNSFTNLSLDVTCSAAGGQVVSFALQVITFLSAGNTQPGAWAIRAFRTS